MTQNFCFYIPTGKNRKNKKFGSAVLPEHVQKELLKLHGIEFHDNIVIIEEATSIRIKTPDEQKMRLLRNRLTEPHTQGEQQTLQMILLKMLIL